MTQSYTKDEINYTRTKEKDQFFSSNSIIRRAPHDSANFYLKLSTNLIKDKRVSNDCFRMLTLLLSKSDAWEIVPKALKQELLEYGIGLNKTYDLISEAIELGYMKRVAIKQKNLVVRYDYFVSEEPCFSNNSSAITDFVITETVKHNNNQVCIYKRNNTKKQTAPLKEPIIPLFSYEWRNPKTGQMQKIENGVTNEEFEKLKSQLGETRIRSVCNMMKNYADNGNGTILFKDKNLYTKILDWNRRADLSKKEKEQKTKEKELRQGEKPSEKLSEKPKEGGVMDQIQDRVEQYKSHEAKITEKFIEQNPDLRDDIKIYENKIEVRNIVNKKRFDQIILPEPAIKQKLERWAEEFRDNRG